MAIPARTVATAVEYRLPGLGELKLHKLLYLVQGHHLAAFGSGVFGEHIEAWEHGPVVAALWRERKHGLPVDEPPGTHVDPLPLTEAELNTVGFVVARYGTMTGRDLEDLTHEQSPWKDAWARGRSGERIAPDAIARFFASYADRTDLEVEHDESPPAAEVVGNGCVMPLCARRIPCTSMRSTRSARWQADDLGAPTLLEPVGFGERAAAWIAVEDPPHSQVSALVSWIERLLDNPYLGGGVRQLDLAPNLWWARVPRTRRGDTDVYCSYWIEEELRRVRCDSIATLAS